MIKTKIQSIVIGLGVIAGSVIATDFISSRGNVSGINGGLFISNAEARLGRPRTARSVAGVSRRTTRRRIRRSTRYVATLPRSCSIVTIEGTRLHHCGSTYYQSHSNKYVVVIIE